MSTIPYRYTEHSRRSRALGTAVAELLDVYDDIELPSDTDISLLTEHALVARARHLFVAAYRAADVGDDYSSTLLLRSLNETGMTLAWLMIDPEAASIVMRLDEIRTRISMHKEYARQARNDRRALRRGGAEVPELVPGTTLGLLDRSTLLRLKLEESHLRGELDGLPRRAPRLRRLGVTSPNRVPAFKTQASKSGNPWMYTAAYRFDSNSAGHPTLLGLQQFVEVRGAGYIVRSSPAGARPDPYGTGAVLLGIVAQLAGRSPGHPLIDTDRLEALEAELRSLSWAG